MEIYRTDDGHIMEEDDFKAFVMMKIQECILKQEEYCHILDADYWGDQLLVPEILLNIKQYSNNDKNK